MKTDFMLHLIQDSSSNYLQFPIKWTAKSMELFFQQFLFAERVYPSS